MNDPGIRLLRNHFLRLAAHEDVLSAHFLRELHALEPRLRYRQPGLPTLRQGCILRQLGALLLIAEQPEPLRATLLQSLHHLRQIGLAPRDFDNVGLAFLRALQLVLGTELTPSLRGAWITFHRRLRDAIGVHGLQRLATAA